MRRGKRHVSKHASWVKEWSWRGRPNRPRWSCDRVGRVRFHAGGAPSEPVTMVWNAPQRVASPREERCSPCSGSLLAVSIPRYCLLYLISAACLCRSVVVGLVLASQAVRALVTAPSFTASLFWFGGRLATGAALAGAGLLGGGCGSVGSATVENTACVAGMRESSVAVRGFRGTTTDGTLVLGGTCGGNVSRGNAQQAR